MYSVNGILLNDSSLYEGQTTKITYSGLLADKGANEVFIHLGYGLLWENLSEIKMTKNGDAFEADIPLLMADSINFCFRDNANNWDNNSYQNYSYEVKKMPKIEPAGLPKRNMSDSLDLSSGYAYSNLVSQEISMPVESAFSMIPAINSEFGQFRRLPENYIRNKKIRVMFYRMFAYVPRMLNGHNKKRAKQFLGH